MKWFEYLLVALVITCCCLILAGPRVQRLEARIARLESLVPPEIITLPEESVAENWWSIDNVITVPEGQTLRDVPGLSFETDKVLTLPKTAEILTTVLSVDEIQVKGKTIDFVGLIQLMKECRDALREIAAKK